MHVSASKVLCLQHSGKMFMFPQLNTHISTGQFIYKCSVLKMEGLCSTASLLIFIKNYDSWYHIPPSKAKMWYYEKVAKSKRFFN